MEYNNYYQVQSGHPPPNQQHAAGPPQMQQQQPPPPPQSGGHMMHSPMPQQNIRQQMPPGPPNHLQQMQQMQSQQQQQHIGHHPQQLNPQQQQQQQQQQQHPNYQQIQPPHSHGPPVSHSSSPHAQQQQQPPQQQQQHHHHQPPPHQQPHQHQHQHQHQHHTHSHSHQANMPGQLPQSQGMSQHNTHVHSQSPHHHGGPLHMHQHQQQSLNQMVRPPVGPSVMNHPQPGIPQPIHHQHNFFTGGGTMPQQANIHHYPQNPHHPNHHQSQHHQPPVMHHIPPISAQHPQMNQNIGRNSSPYYPNILQTEFRIIELNRRLQCRPISRYPCNPLPGSYDESIWWERLAYDFFEDDATLTLRMRDDKPIDYTIGRTLIPRFFRSYFTGGVTDLSFNLRNPKETCIHPNLITLDCDQAFIVTNNTFRHPSIPGHQGAVVHTEGQLVIDFVSNSFDNLSIKSWRFYFKGCREYVDRSIMSTMGLPANYLAEPITNNGFTRSTLTYLKMCMIMEPMQELMFQNRQTKLDPRACLRKLLFDRHKFRSGEDNRAATNKRRKRKPSTATTVANNANTNKKSKPGINNAIGNNSGINNMMMSPSNMGPNISLASQDVMVVGEPSMMGGDFGDDNERMITRLENTQYDPTLSNHSIVDESDSTNAPTSGDITQTSEEMDQSLENRTHVPSLIQQSLSPSSQQQRHQQSQALQEQHQQHQRQQQIQRQTQQQQQQQIPQQSNQQSEQQQEHQAGSHPIQVQAQDTHYHPSQLQHNSPKLIEQHIETLQNQTETFQPSDGIKIEPEDPLQVPNDLHLDSDDKEPTIRNEETLYLQSQNDDRSRQLTQDQDNSSTEKVQAATQNGNIGHSQSQAQQIVKEESNHRPSDNLSQKDDNNHHVSEETTMNSISDVSIDASIVNNVGSVEAPENHSELIQMMQEEPDSNSLLQCSTPSTKSTIEQQQPVDNGFA